jgi:aryl-alcohol dehydrogenase-like predicted oxidoreductase
MEKSGQIIELFFKHLGCFDNTPKTYEFLARYQIYTKSKMIFRISLIFNDLSGNYNHHFPEDTRLSIEGLDWLKDRELTEQRIGKVRKLTAFAQELGTTMPLLALAWAIKPSYVSTAITGASKVSQLQENLKAIEVAATILTPEVMNKIEEILDNKPAQPMF